MKSQLTKDMERYFVEYLYEIKGEYAIAESRLGLGKRLGIVDVMSYSGKLIRNGRGRPTTREATFRCYELKVSKSDFYSKAKLTFEGHYNYFVIPHTLYKTVINDVPKEIGVYVYYPDSPSLKNKFDLIKRATQCKPGLSEEQLMHNFIVSSSRDARRWIMREK